jgi:hypothetical protein
MIINEHHDVIRRIYGCTVARRGIVNSNIAPSPERWRRLNPMLLAWKSTVSAK